MRLECRGMSKILRNGVVVRSWCRFPRQVGAAAGTAGVIGVSEPCSSVLAWASPHHPYYPTTYYLPPHHPTTTSTSTPPTPFPPIPAYRGATVINLRPQYEYAQFVREATFF